MMAGVLLAAGGVTAGVNRELADVVEAVRADLEPLDLEQPTAASEAATAYFKAYGLDVPDVTHRFGTFDAGGYRLAAHVFVPEQARGTVIGVHGYYDHAGVWKHVIRRLVADGYAVAFYDQPGHGLSSGARASIGSFDEYLAVLQSFMAICREHLEGPYHVVAHSTGASVVMDYLLNVERPAVDRVVLISPLIRSVAWGISGFGQKLMGKRVDSVPRKFRKNSSDEAFLAFVKADPLHARRVPTTWVSAHRDWVDKIVKDSPTAKPVKIIQGTKDTTVSWKFNVRVIRDKFPNAEISLVEEGGHQLINEVEPLRKQALDLMSAWLKGQGN